jgi:IS5 family transposase
LTLPSKKSNVQKGAKNWYSGKKKRYTIKTQVIINGETQEIICIAQATGKTHDFKLFKDEFIGIDELIQVLADSGYQGIVELHANSKTPIKKKKNQELTEEQKRYNRELSRVRILIENVNRRIKRFKIMCDRYRNKRKRHGLRMTLICGLHNIDLGGA